ncbi:hypothetical protein RHMOL_Rhmol11G0045300 [Rhododendron molle]|uniref:Uncharacterized protein n=1 Tax=Rhododendron molle TaxID=49168 RepID=A0ACC0LNL0_RHOML|nr:hypothetical protein RHMOL_Rhmol11G0045300 [Rhododendron molle]
MVDASCGGTFMLKTPDEAWVLFDNLSNNSQQHASAAKRVNMMASNSQQQRGFYDVGHSNDLSNQVAALNKKFDQLLSLGQVPSQPSYFQEACAICSSPTHFVSECHWLPNTPSLFKSKLALLKGLPNPVVILILIHTTRDEEITQISLGNNKLRAILLFHPNAHVYQLCQSFSLPFDSTTTTISVP